MLKKLIEFLEQYDGINDKQRLAALVGARFGCHKDRSVYYTDDFSIRFCKANSAVFGNTVLSLSALRKRDDKPFIVCVCSPLKNHLLLANSTFLSKISHSSQELRVDNIRGSFNGSDIMRRPNGIANSPENFDILFELHRNIPFAHNLARLANATAEIAPTGVKFDINAGKRLETILASPDRAIDFVRSGYYSDLLSELDAKTARYKNEILAASAIENVNLRGRIIEYIIAGDDNETRRAIIKAVTNGTALPEFVTRDRLGDYTAKFPGFLVETDIKSKLMTADSAPKGYNLDKMLEFLSKDGSVFMLYFVGSDCGRKTIKTKLISIFQEALLDGTAVQSHWAGRNSRGATQFSGEAVKKIILSEESSINNLRARRFINELLSL